MGTKQKRDNFKLRISGISLGSHKFSIACDKEFFETSGIEELQDGVINVEIDLEKDESMLHLFFQFKGEVVALCDRCLDPLSFEMDFEEEIVVKLVPFKVEEDMTEEDGIWLINENEYDLDVYHFVYESIRLAMPIQIMHPDRPDGTSTCNPEVLKRLEKLIPKENPKETDSRWDALKDIKLD